MSLEKAKNKALEHLVSWKFHLLLISTYLFMKGTLSENGWLIMAGATTGLRDLVNLVSLKLGGTTDGAGEVDNPDAPPAKGKKK